MFKLVISDDEGKTTVVPLVREEVTIGRDEENTIRLTERNVSRRHAKLERLNGSYTVADLGSYNGVKINGSKIDGKSKLKAGDQIGIGDFLLAFHVAIADQMTDPAASALGSEETDPLAMAANQDTAILHGPRGDYPARFVMVSLPKPGNEYALREGRTRIGRMEDAGMWVNHKSISREHAEIVKTGETYRVLDLGSSNGVRVNGREVKDVELRSGDILELGQVRFKYVAAGEAYAFDPTENTGQTEILRVQQGSRVPLYAGIAVVSLALGLLAVFLTRSSDAARPRAEVANASPTPGVPAMSEPEAQAAVSACERALSANQFGEAMRVVGPVLQSLPTYGGALSCRRAAEVGLSDQENFERGTAALTRGDAVAAYDAFGRLSTGSAFLERPEVQKAAADYAKWHLGEARAALRSEPDKAREHAQAVLNMRDVMSEWQHAAEKILSQSTGEVVAEEDTSRTRPDRPRHSSHTATPTATPSATAYVSATQACVSEGGDVSSCVIRKIGNNARNPSELSELIEAYRSQRDTANMLRQMKRFTEQYAANPKAAAYNQILMRHETP